MHTPTADPTRCPICGSSNQCAMEQQRASGQLQPPCWCTRAAISPEALARIPQASRGRACICPACAKAAAQ